MYIVNTIFSKKTLIFHIFVNCEQKRKILFMNFYMQKMISQVIFHIFRKKDCELCTLFSCVEQNLFHEGRRSGGNVGSGKLSEMREQREARTVGKVGMVGTAETVGMVGAVGAVGAVGTAGTVGKAGKTKNRKCEKIALPENGCGGRKKKRKIKIRKSRETY